MSQDIMAAPDGIEVIGNTLLTWIYNLSFLVDTAERTYAEYWSDNSFGTYINGLADADMVPGTALTAAQFKAIYGIVEQFRTWSVEAGRKNVIYRGALLHEDPV